MKRLNLTATERELIKRRAVANDKDIPFFKFMKQWDGEEKVMFSLFGVFVYLIIGWLFSALFFIGLVAGIIGMVGFVALPVIVRSIFHLVYQQKLAAQYRHRYYGSYSYYGRNDQVRGFTTPSSVNDIWSKAKSCKRSPESLAALAELCGSLTLTLMDLPETSSFVDDAERATVQEMLDGRFADAQKLAGAIVEFENNSQSLDSRVVAKRVAQEAEAWNKLRAANSIPTDSLTEMLADCSERLKGAAINLSKSK